VIKGSVQGLPWQALAELTIAMVGRSSGRRRRVA
jgi:hypothetical protein